MAEQYIADRYFWARPASGGEFRPHTFNADKTEIWDEYSDSWDSIKDWEIADEIILPEHLRGK